MSEKNPDDPDRLNPPRRKRVTLRDIAKELGVSHVTVSKALRGQSGASKEMQERIRRKADEMGYAPDPMLSALSSYRKLNRGHSVQSELAWINTWPEPEKLRQHREFDLYWQGAAETAKGFGYTLQAFNLAEIPSKRLESILHTRNIQGILLPPDGNENDSNQLEDFDWSDFSIIRFGHTAAYPKTHYVTSAQMMNTLMSFDRIEQLGYKRIGFVCEYWQQRYFSVGYSWAQKKRPPEQRLPPLLLNTADSAAEQQKQLGEWLQHTRPDAIITDKNEIPQMLTDLGLRIPEDVGLATTSIHDTIIDAGIDQRPLEIGRAAVRILTALIADRSFGIPDCRHETLIEGDWVDGSMLPDRSA